MNKTTVQLSSATIFQVEAGAVKGIRDGGDLYLLVQSEEGFAESTDEPEQKTRSIAPERGATQAPSASTGTAPATAEAPPIYTEAELTKMSNDEIFDILDYYQIDPKQHEGMNTNKKLRLLVLGAQNNGQGGEVVDDTAPATATRTPRAGAQPATQAPVAEKPARTQRGATQAPASDAPVEIPRAEWDALEAGTLVLAKLDMEGADGDKFWEAEVDGWDVPNGGQEEELYVKFLADNETDFLRATDKLFTYQKQL